MKNDKTRQDKETWEHVVVGENECDAKRNVVRRKGRWTERAVVSLSIVYLRETEDGVQHWYKFEELGKY